MGGTVEGASKWDGSQTVGSNLANVGEQALKTGAVVGASTMILSGATDALLTPGADKVAEKIAAKHAEAVASGAAKDAAELGIVAAVVEKGKSLATGQVINQGSGAAKDAALKDDAAAPLVASADHLEGSREPKGRRDEKQEADAKSPIQNGAPRTVHIPEPDELTLPAST